MRTAQLVVEHDAAEREIERTRRERRELGATVRELSTEWLDYVRREKGAKPATIQDYGYLLTEPGTPHRRGPGRSPGRIMHALGDRRIAKVTTAEVATFLRGLEREGMSARSVNKHREVLGAMFSYAQREDTYAPAAAYPKGYAYDPASWLVDCRALGLHQSNMTTISLCRPTAFWTCGWIGSTVSVRLGMSCATRCACAWAPGG